MADRRHADRRRHLLPDSVLVIDFGYSFTITDLWNTTYASSFANTTSGFNTAAILSGSHTGSLNTHTLTVSINRRF